MDRSPKELNVDRVDDYTVKPIPQGEDMFEFAVLPGKNQALVVFVDSGADGWVVKDEVLQEERLFPGGDGLGVETAGEVEKGHQEPHLFPGGDGLGAEIGGKEEKT